MIILITGADGQLGTAIKNALSPDSALTVIALNKHEMDISDIQSVKMTFDKYQPNWVINTAAFTGVDEAEIKVDTAIALNMVGPHYLARECTRFGARLIHFSTDYVFDGEKREAYTESDKCSPLSIYGETKLAGEEAVLRLCKEAIVLRISWLFSAKGKNFVKTIIRLLEEKTFLTVVNDQHGCPTSANSVANLVKKIIKDKPALSGLFHYTNQGATTWHGFAQAIQQLYFKGNQAAEKEIRPVSSIDFQTKAPRPQNSVLDSTKIITQLGVTPEHWETELEKVVGELLDADVYA